ncbi:MAG: DNA internalization-related competence protein ComEC/Rec2 [Clostridium sp.]|nr:DNA internalization-related competence protein ComEC/Rec2 [Clostridium sp.]
MAYLADRATAMGTGMSFFLPALFFSAAAAAGIYACSGRGRLPVLLLFLLAGFFRMEASLVREPEELLLEREGAAYGAGVRGTVSQAEEKDGAVILVLSGGDIGGEPVSGKIRVRAAAEDCSRLPEAGDTVLAEGKLSLFPEASNPGQFDMRTYYRGLGIRYSLLADRLSAVPSGKERAPVDRMAGKLRAFFGRCFTEICPEEDAAIYRALLLGDRSGLPEELQELFRDGGISHILAVSGLHVSLIGLTFYGALRTAGAGYGCAGFMTMVLLMLYGTVTGFGPSVFRAVFMVLCRLAAAVPGRGYDLLSAWGLALLIAAAHSPWMLFSSGLQLSFGAVLAIGVLSDLETRRKKERLLSGGEEGRRIPEALRTGLFIQLWTMPLILRHYFTLPAAAALLNLVVIPLLAYAAGSGIFAAGLYALSAGLARCGIPGLSAHILSAAGIAVGPGHYIFALYRLLCEAAGRLPVTGITPGQPGLLRIALFYGLLFSVFCVQIPKDSETLGRWRVLAAVLLLLCHPVRGLHVWFLDVGQGDGVFLQTREAAILSDCGSSQESALGEMRLGPFLKSRGVTHLDYILVSHGDEDHISGIRWLLAEEEDIRADILVLPESGQDDAACRELENLAARRGMRTVRMKAGDFLRCGELRLSCLAPPPGYRGNPDDRNADSLVFLADYRKFRMLLTGDIGFPEEEGILKRAGSPCAPVSVLKTAHHGSKTSTSEAFLRHFPPRLAVISCGKGNVYGHPDPETLRRLRESGAGILCTEWSGAVHIWTNGSRMRYTEYRKTRQSAGNPAQDPGEETGK